MGYIDRSQNKVFYTTKTQLKIAGSRIEIRKFGRNFFIGDRPKSFKDKEEKAKNKYSDEDIQERRYRRAKRDLLDYVDCNVNAWPNPHTGHIDPSTFITFTFAKGTQDIHTANYEFTKFIQRFNLLAFGQKNSLLKYAVVIEFQKNTDFHGKIKLSGGSIHYHAVFFNLPYIKGVKKKVEKLWSNGFIKLVTASRVKNVALYISKYMSKKFDDPRLRGKKCYFVSRGLKHPTLVYYDILIAQFLSFLPENSIEYKGVIDLKDNYMISLDFTRYNLEKFPQALALALAFLKSTGYDGPARTPTIEELELLNLFNS